MSLVYSSRGKTWSGKQRDVMDFIERWFGLSPDGGDGTTELMYIIALAAIVVAVFGRSVYRRYFKP